VKLKTIAHCIAIIGVTGVSATSAVAQEKPADVTQRIEITGSSIKRIAAEGALPVEVITRKQLEASGIVTAEQLIATLNINGNGSDNLASNADVTSGAQRGNNGATSANLRGQGSDSTLVLLNGRRIATHGMKGSAVDLNSIPMAAVERVEVLKDGASAIYGTDAIGGVINFILRKNYNGIEAQAFTDLTQQGGADIHRVSIVGGFGNLESDGYNVLITGTHSENQALRGDQRSFVNTFQPNRGLSVDTRGTPFATVFATSLANTIMSNKSNTGYILPGTNQSMNAVNVLNLPGGAGCNSIDGMAAYDYKIWDVASSKYACAWDTGRAAVLQQPVTNDNFVSRATFKVGEHQVFAELVGSRVDVSKASRRIRCRPAATSRYRRSILKPALRMTWYSIPSLRSYQALNPITARLSLIAGVVWSAATVKSAPVPMPPVCKSAPMDQIGNWDYRVGLSRAYSESQSTLGNGYNYTVALANALGTGIINPFLLPGQKQSQAALDLIASTSAKGVVLYGGKTTLTQADAAIW
jgi:iron complex outermembrane receptor protein